MLGSVDVSIPAAFVAGVFSFLSPCVLPLVPVYLANLGGVTTLTAEAKRWTIFLHAVSFVAGFSIVFIAIGASAGLLGLFIPANVLRIVGGVVLILFGLFLIAATRVPWLNYEVRLGRALGGGAGHVRSILLGAAFGLGWTPCVGPILGGILTLAATSQTAWKGVYLLALYSLGLGIPFIAVGLALGAAMPVIRWLRRWSGVISIVSGLLLIVVGALMLTNTLMYFA
ncbi:MAG: cytochrome c biogenesis protein CcdA [Chloroflexota bacterium]|nr:cytochrome c biogenesis protein CcdA [Chloroflexota bacterium]